MVPSFLDYFPCQTPDSNIYTTSNKRATVIREQPKITLVKGCSLPQYWRCMFLMLCSVRSCLTGRNEEIQGGFASTASLVVFKKTYKCVEFILLWKEEAVLYVFKGRMLPEWILKENHRKVEIILSLLSVSSWTYLLILRFKLHFIVPWAIWTHRN